MRPILFEISLSEAFRFPMPAYGSMLTIGFIVAIFLAALRARDIELKSIEVIELGYFAFIGGIIGARMLHVALNLERYLGGTDSLISMSGIIAILWNTIAFWNGGLAFYGGLFGGITAILLYAKYKKISGLELLDLLTPPTAIGLAVTRLGCFLNGCCFGKHTDVPWALQFPSHSYAYFHQWHLGLIEIGDRPLPVHPTQLYELVAALIIFAYLWMRYPQRKFAGEIFFTFGLMYSAWRFMIEFWRADSSIWSSQLHDWVVSIGPFTIYQLLSILIFGVLISLMIWALGRTKPQSGKISGI